MKFKEIHSGQEFALDGRKSARYLRLNEAWSLVDNESPLCPEGDDACIEISADVAALAPLRHIDVGEVVYFDDDGAADGTLWWATRRIA